MTLSGVLDVVIGIVFVWFLLSLVISAVNEAFAWLTKARSKLLWRSLARLFSDQVESPGGRLHDLFVVLPSGREDYRPTSTHNQSALSGARDRAPKVTTVPEEHVAEKLQQLYQIISRRVADTAPKSWRTRIASVPKEAVSDALLRLAEATVTKTSLIATTTDVDLQLWLSTRPDGPLEKATVDKEVPPALKEPLDEAWVLAARVLTFDDLEAIVSKNTALARSLRSVRDTFVGSEQMVHARAEIERWFDSSMDALSTFYRHQARKIAAVIAVPLVLLTTSDSLDLFQRLRGDQDLRAAAASSAAGWVAEPLSTVQGTGAIDLDAVCSRVAPTTTTTSTTTTTTSTTTTVTPSTTTEDETTKAIDEARRRLDCASDLVKSTSLIRYIGPGGLWKEIRTSDSDNSSCELCDVFSWVRDGLLGRVVTWIALLFGAGFWYDVLRRLVGLKGSTGGSGSSDG